MNFILTLIGPDKVGGWIRSAVATALGGVAISLSPQIPWIKDILSPEVIQGIAASLSVAAVGLWSHLAKSSTSSTPSNPNVSLQA